MTQPGERESDRRPARRGKPRPVLGGPAQTGDLDPEGPVGAEAASGSTRQLQAFPSRNVSDDPVAMSCAAQSPQIMTLPVGSTAGMNFLGQAAS